ncbi:NAD(P)-dependent oxidoreductase [Streptomyces sp. NPDC005549]|uniref:NAD-dependent epimerase/dehydratase family protein n=1 Tax=Streptomyces sp. NPDC005549 TaxID=3154888 RepID=UPI0033B7A547
MAPAESGTRRTVMVTGGLGMIGALTCREMLADGITPVIYDLGTNTALLGDIADQCVIRQGDITDVPKMLSVLKENPVQSIVHLAGRLGPEVEKAPWGALSSNLVGFAAVLECAHLTGVGRVVFASSKTVYGPVREEYRHPHYAPLPEEHPREPNSLYGKLKRASEDLGEHYANMHGLDVIALRFGSSISPGKAGRHSKVSPVVAMLQAAATGERFALASGGDQRDDLCYAGESANGIVAALNSAPHTGFRAYNIAAGELLSLRDMAKVLMDSHRGWSCEIGDGLDYRGMGLGFYYRMDISKAQRELGFVSRYPFHELAADYEAAVKKAEAR